MNRILVIEPETAAREILRSRLSGAQNQVTLCGSTEDGMRQAGSAAWDLVLVGWCQDGGMDGAGLCRELRGSALLRDTPIILRHLGRLNEAQHARGYDAGAQRVVDEDQDHALEHIISVCLRISARAVALLERARVLRTESPEAGGENEAGLPDALLLVDGAGRVLALDRGAGSLLGTLSPGSSLEDLAPGSALGDEAREARRATCTGLRLDLPARGARPPRSLAVTIRPFQDPGQSADSQASLVLLNDLGRRSVTQPLVRGLDPVLPERHAGPLLEAARLRYGLQRVVGPGSGSRWSRECERLAQLAAGGKPILLVGGSAAGRQELARCLHHLSRGAVSRGAVSRGAWAFHVLDCPGLGPDSQASELWGTEATRSGQIEPEAAVSRSVDPGATVSRLVDAGAADPWPGLLTLARGGSLYLAGLEHLDLELQRELGARMAQSGDDPRWIAGLDGDPAELVEEGALDATFAARWTRVELSPVILEPERPPRREPVPAAWRITDDDPVSLEHYEKQAILRAIDACNGDKQAAARLLRLGKSTMYRKVNRYGIP